MAGGWGGNDESESVSLDGEDVNDFSSGWENIYNKDVNEEDCEWEEIGKPPSTLNNKVHPKPTTRSCDFLSLSELWNTCGDCFYGCFIYLFTVNNLWHYMFAFNNGYKP